MNYSENLAVSPFSYKEYNLIIEKYQSRIIDFLEVDSNDFVLIRHDVEFSCERALSIAYLDAKWSIPSSFLFQAKSNAYNPLSTVNSEIIRKICDLGCHVGLHLYVSHIEDGNWEKLEEELINQKSIIELITGHPCDRFSFHRPPKWVLECRDDYIADTLNIYGKSFFEFNSNPKTIKYLADSQHRFQYGHPLNDYSQQKMQILLHPDEWSDDGLNEEKNFRALESEHIVQFYKTLDSETKHFAKHYPSKITK
ncbi:hypothetical protein OAP43_04040 [Candidatus Pseudothioglobus singularis]|nr:hypothetical protein [Candidatus Pseudothioglobus singularis]